MKNKIQYRKKTTKSEITALCDNRFDRKLHKVLMVTRAGCFCQRGEGRVFIKGFQKTPPELQIQRKREAFNGKEGR